MRFGRKTDYEKRRNYDEKIFKKSGSSHDGSSNGGYLWQPAGPARQVRAEKVLRQQAVKAQQRAEQLQK